MDRLQKFYIDGIWTDPQSSDSMPVLNPATGEQLGMVALGNAADVDRAVAAASAAFERFSRTSKDERLALLRRIKVLSEERLEDMAQAMRKEMGAPITMAREMQADAGMGYRTSAGVY